jgi:membrane-bound serine protease (ClpP class)
MEGLVSDGFVSSLFLFAGLIFLLLEIFIPSFGVLGLLALASITFGVYGLFHQGHMGLALMAVLFYLVVVWVAFRFMVKRLNFAGALPPETSTSVDRRIGALVGREGVALTALRPAGMVLIDGQKVDVVTQGDFIEKDAPVRVIDNSGNRVVVKAVGSEQRA